MSSRRRRPRCWITCTRSSIWPSASGDWSRRSTEAVKTAPPQMRAVIEALQALRGIAQVSAVTIVAEVGELSRFARARQLMGYSGAVRQRSTPAESESRRGAITKTGNAHLRRIVDRGGVGLSTPAGDRASAYANDKSGLSEEVKEIAWKAQHRLHERYRKLNRSAARTSRKSSRRSGASCLGFIWAIGVQVEPNAQRVA